MKLPLLSAALLLSGFSYAQYCTSGGPTSTADSNVQLVRLLGQNDSIRYVGCPGVLGVQNLTNLSTSLVAGNAYTIQVQFGTCGGNYFGGGEVWIDFDQSSSFDPWESLGTWTGTPPVALSSFNFTVPSGSQNGATRMRVMQREGSTAIPPLDPCGTFTWGSVMDFTIQISGGIDCSAYTGDDTTDPIPVSVLPYTHNWDNSFCYTNQNHVYPSPDVYYRVILSPQSGTLRASTCGSSFDTFLSVLDVNGNVLAYNDDAANCAPQSELVFSTVGLDTVYVVVEGWGSLSGPYTLQLNESLVGLEEISITAAAIFPNPASGAFRISGLPKGELRISDISGQQLMKIAAYDGSEISTAGLAPGIYFVSFGNSPATQKLVISQ